jgi:predicted short-subunit dehydrogenase-like oxidoreductase (DUF2520 family)
MKEKGRQRVVIIGCGNLARHLASHLSSLMLFDILLYNHRNNSKLKYFEDELNCQVFNNLKNIADDADFYFICVTDKYIAAVSERIKPIKDHSIVIHTSGASPINEIVTNVPHKAVFYPLQTFSWQLDARWSDIPILLETSSAFSKKSILELGERFSDKIILLEFNERQKLHLAAVLVNNFSNALYAAADNFISENVDHDNINFEILMPLIQQTVLKLEVMAPLVAQTGPSLRGDKKTMAKHRELMVGDPLLQSVYKKLSSLIEQQHKTMGQKKTAAVEDKVRKRKQAKISKQK